MTTEAGTTNKAEQTESEHDSDYRLCRTPHQTAPYFIKSKLDCKEFGQRPSCL